MAREEYSTGREFEDEVRRIARLLWLSAKRGGAEIVDGRERDGVFVGDDIVHLIECTMQPKKDKAVQDGAKLAKLKGDLEKKHPTKAVKCWFVTYHEPTPDQKSALAKYPAGITAIAFADFRAQLVDARQYIDARRNYPFGSMTDPGTGKTGELNDFVEIGISSHDGVTYGIKEISDALLFASHFILLGDYGAGKSTNLREVFLYLEKRFRKKQVTKFPVHLNLKDHFGQDDPSEALIRHSVKIGFETGNKLIRAWRAGDVIVLLDGFDELGTVGWAGPVKKMRDIRYQSMQLIRAFIQESPQDAGVLISGRAHYFDSEPEMLNAFGVPDGWVRLSLSDFTDDQVRQYLNKKGWNQSLPEWVPTRPLLLGHLAASGLLDELIHGNGVFGPAEGWNKLLEFIARRESKITKTIDSHTVRRIMERLATKARKTHDGVGPLQFGDIALAFREVCGYEPDPAGLTLLQRLPGLGTTGQDGSRSLIDQDLADAARAGDVFEYIQNPFGEVLTTSIDWQTALGSLGAQVVAQRARLGSFTASKVSLAAHEAFTRGDLDVLCADIFLTLQELNQGYVDKNITIRETILGDLTLASSSEDYSGLEFKDCIVQHLEIDSDVRADKIPRFRNCYFAVVEGRVSKDDLPATAFIDCEFDRDAFQAGAVNAAAILAIDTLSVAQRVLLTILRKLYLQRGRGRKESALYRGLDPRERELVPGIIRLLQRNGLIMKGRPVEEVIWLPVRSASIRVRRLLATPHEAHDDIMGEANEAH